MATVDEFKIEFNSEGAQDLANSLKNIQLYAQKAAAKVDELSGKTSNLGGVQDKSSKKKIAGDKKVAKEEVKTQKRTLESNKSLHESLSKIENVIKGVASFSAIKSAFSFVNNQASEASSRYNDLDSRSKSTNIARAELDAVRYALKNEGSNENALDQFTSMFGDNANKFKAGLGLNADYADIIAKFNGMEQNGLKVDFAKTDFLGVLKDIQKSLSAEKNSSRRLELAKILGLDQNGTSFLLSDTALSSIESSYKNSLAKEKNREKSQQGEKTKAYNKSGARLSNSAETFGDKFVKLGTDANNALADVFDFASDKGKYKAILKERTEESKKKVLDNIESIDAEKGAVKLKNGRVFEENGILDKVTFSYEDRQIYLEALRKEREKKNIKAPKGVNTSSLLSPEMMERLTSDNANAAFLGASNNMTTRNVTNITVQELHVISNADSVAGVMADASLQAKWTFEGASAIDALTYGRVVS